MKPSQEIYIKALQLKEKDTLWNRITVSNSTYGFIALLEYLDEQAEKKEQA